MQDVNTVNPSNCPLCNGDNACFNLSDKDEQACWCKNPDLKFPESLLKKIPEQAKNNACICQACVLAHQKAINN